MSIRVPTRFQAICEMCGDAVDVRQEGVYRYTSGWVKQRGAGGGNAVTLSEKHNLWACGLCIDSHNHPSGQASLFG